jgi:putative phosphoribosyl transferase
VESIMNMHQSSAPTQLDPSTPDSVRHAGHPVTVPVGPVHLEGELVIPHAAVGVVIFAHGSGSSRHSPRNQFVASALQKAGLATVLLDLFTREEARGAEQSGGVRFNVELMAHRLTCAVQWLEARELLDGPVGLFGAGAGAGISTAPAPAGHRRGGRLPRRSVRPGGQGTVRGRRADASDRRRRGHGRP